MKHYVVYSFLILLTIFLGLQTRNESIELPYIIKEYGGDTLWTLMVYWGFRLISPKRKASFALISALIFSFLIELSQLYQADWANEFRKTRIAALVFGSGFLWSDLLCYTVGAFMGFGIDFFVLNKKKVDLRNQKIKGA